MTLDIIESPLARATFSYVDRLPAGEREWVNLFLAEMAQFYAESGVTVTPPMLIRLDVVVQEYLTARRLNAAVIDTMAPDPDTAGANADATPSGDPNQSAAENSSEQLSLKSTARSKSTSASPIEAAAKARERMRKTMAELDESLAKTMPANRRQGVADRMRPLLLATRGILEEVVEHRPPGREGRG